MATDSERARRYLNRAEEIRRLADEAPEVDACCGLKPLAEQYERLAADVMRLVAPWREYVRNHYPRRSTMAPRIPVRVSRKRRFVRR